MNALEKGYKKLFCISPFDFIESNIYRRWIKIKYRDDHVRYKRAENTFYQKYRNKQISILQKKFSKQRALAKEYIDKTDHELPHSKEKVIWIFWYQGLADAPALVKTCYKSICERLKDYEIRFLDKFTYTNYVDLPDNIINKFKEGKISHAFLSDLIRLELLIRYGGTWIDATILCVSDEIPDFYLESEFFMFQAIYADNVNTASSIDNYFITSYSNNKILRLTQMLLFDYWKKYDVVNDYLIFYDMFELALESYPEEWEKVIPVSRGNSQMLAHVWGREYNSKVYDAISRQCPFQKLSYRYVPTDILSTFYEKILQGQY